MQICDNNNTVNILTSKKNVHWIIKYANMNISVLLISVHAHEYLHAHTRTLACTHTHKCVHNISPAYMR